jgi:prepilin-type N-terminal cleavage/methylation domain-containing protein/prepilin-type processing-associated H-X9-DG protein
MLTKTTCADGPDQRSPGTNGLVPSAFTLIELLVVIAVLALFATLLAPASAHLRPNSQAVQCLNNLRQLASAWKMYADDNGSKIVSAYPAYGGFTGTWCGGDAETGGYSGSYLYSGADPTGIQAGLLWPYTKTLGLYHCPTDHRIADGAGVPTQFKGRPILRSISMNAFMAGRSLGASPDWVVTNPTGARDPNHPVYVKESEIRLPKQTFVLADEDQESINDGMLLVDVGGSWRLLDLPSRAHRFGFGICFADGHAKMEQLTDDASKNWRVTAPRPSGGINDWMRLTNVTTHPL